LLPVLIDLLPVLIDLPPVLIDLLPVLIDLLPVLLTDFPSSRLTKVATGADSSGASIHRCLAQAA
jgi:hypothetical protein